MSNVDIIHPIRTLDEDVLHPNSVAFSPDGNYIAYNDSYRIILRNFQSGQIKGYDKLNYDDDTVYSIAFSPDGTQIVSGNTRDKVCIWDVESKKKIATLKLHTDYVSNTYVYSVAFSPDGKYIVAGCGNKTVHLWDAESRVQAYISEWNSRAQTRISVAHESREQIAILKGHTSDVRSVAFSPDSTQIVSGSSDRTVRLWDVQSSHLKATLEGHTYGVYSVAFSPDGNYIVSGSSDETVRLWDVKSKKQIATLEGHTHYVKSVAFSHDGNYIVSGSGDNTIRLWDVRSKEQLATLKGHTKKEGAFAGVNSVAFSPDGYYILSCGNDETVRLWEIGQYTYKPDYVQQDKNMNTLGSQMPLDMNVELMKYLNNEDRYKLLKEAKKSEPLDTRVRYMKKLNLKIDEYRDILAYLLRSSDMGSGNEQLLRKWVSTERSRLKKTKKKNQKKGKESSTEKSKSSGKKSRSRGNPSP